MGVTIVKCPNCNSNVTLDENKAKCYCSACGSEIVVSDNTVNNNTYNNVTIEHQTVIKQSESIDDLLKVADAFLNNNDYEKAEKKYDEVINIDPNDCRGLWGMFECEIIRINKSYLEKGYFNYPNDLDTAIENACKRYYEYVLRYASDFEKQTYKKKYEELTKRIEVFRWKKKKKINIVVFIILLIVFWPAAFVYLLYCILNKHIT